MIEKFTPTQEEREKAIALREQLLTTVKMSVVMGLSINIALSTICSTLIELSIICNAEKEDVLQAINEGWEKYQEALDKAKREKNEQS